MNDDTILRDNKKKEEKLKNLNEQLNSIELEQDSIFKRMNERRILLEENKKKEENIKK